MLSIILSSIFLSDCPTVDLGRDNWEYGVWGGRRNINNYLIKRYVPWYMVDRQTYLKQKKSDQ